MTEANILQYLVIMIRVKHLHVLREPGGGSGGIIMNYSEHN